MTAREHMENLAVRYATALVGYHLDRSRYNFNSMTELHEMLNSVCVEVAQEILEERDE